MPLRKTSGVLMAFSAGIGILFCLIGAAALWIYKPVVIGKGIEKLGLVDQTLDSTDVILTTTGKMVQTTSLDVTSMQATTNALSTGIQNANPTFDSLIHLTGTDIPAAIASTQSSLASAQSTALLIDNTLGVITSIPFPPMAPYKPKVPLHVALQNVSSSLNSLTPPLVEISTSLGSEKKDLGAMNDELTKIAASAQTINGSLENAQTTIANYKLTIQQLKQDIETTRQNLTRWIGAACWVLTILALWLIVVLASLLLHGIALIHETTEVIFDLEQEEA